MKAVVFDRHQTTPSLVEVPQPEPGPGEVLLRVAACGACQSDVSIYRHFDETVSWGQFTPPFILGHEISGWVEEVGVGVEELETGAAYLVHGPVGCRQCRACALGHDFACEDLSSLPYRALGLGRDGGMAEYVAVPARNLVPLGDVDPVAAAPLADAALTPYHAVARSMPVLARGGSSALVIGLGGLGQFAVQILRAITGATVIATDPREESLELARARGARTVSAGEDQAEAIRALTDGRGVTAVFDFVGVAQTIELSFAVVTRGGRVTVAGLGGGTFPWSTFAVPAEVELTDTSWGTLAELFEVVDLYRRGAIVSDVEIFALDDALEAYRRLEARELTARAVVVPHLGGEAQGIPSARDRTVSPQGSAPSAPQNRPRRQSRNVQTRAGGLSWPAIEDYPPTRGTIVSRMRIRSALITAGGNGIGRATAVRLASEGVPVAIVDIDGDGLEETRRLVEGVGGRAFTYVEDCTDAEIAVRTVEAARASLGSVDALVNNVGNGPGPLAARLVDQDPEVLETVVRRNLLSALFWVRAAGKELQANGYGKIVNLTSDIGFSGAPKLSEYAGAKAGVVGLTRALSLELAPTVNVNAVGPGPTETVSLSRVDEEFRLKAIDSVPLGRLGQPTDTANAIAFLLSSEADFITGQTLLVGGGRWMH